MIERRLKTVIVIYLWAALVEDTVLFVMAWIAPDIWFRVFHAGVPAGLEIALLRRSAGQWAAFALAQAVTLWRWPKEPVWLQSPQPGTAARAASQGEGREAQKRAAPYSRRLEFLSEKSASLSKRLTMSRCSRS